MIHAIRRSLLVVCIAFTLGAQAQFYRLHGGSISVGATGQFSPQLTSGSNNSVPTVVNSTNGITTASIFTSNRQQYTTTSAGFITSLQFHPVPWAGVEVNYGFTHYSERYTFNYSNSAALQSASVPTDAHEATAAYQFHPRHIPLQPFVNIGGGAIDFNPRNASNQWRGAGLVEVGFDVPTHAKHIGFRVEGRSLFYRSPNFYQPAVSTQSWRTTVSPSVSSYYRF